MNQDYSSKNQSKAMTPDQFDQVVSAILGGKYSWACVLILRFAGYNPLHYIPYRTYKRLVNDNKNPVSDSVNKGKERYRSSYPTNTVSKGSMFL